ncbi:hypothetical protein WR25_18980 [Diploscapter pachys]|uniref:Chondroitin proteoglycan 4 domain-containing protein n=1 Tax=Diploscapter pachys TaxID=2018661 RepID=A0A2A2M065_9BILA|nr:hypothetical protein WR25_18980 [Diploscapter pachys]
MQNSSRSNNFGLPKYTNIFSLGLILLFTLCCSEPLSSRHTNDTFTEDTIYIKIYKECWTKCQETFQIDSNGGEAMKELASGAFNQERHRNYCRHYNTSRECANECVKGQKDHHYYLRPFFRRNYLNEFICFKHYEEFHKSIPCYLAGDVIKSFYNRCGSEFVDDDDAVEASDQTCE